MARTDPDVIVVGGGLAGLTAAAYLARAGSRVVLLEKAAQPGGRARTRTLDGFDFNVGPHALYRTGVGIRILRELGVPVSGGRPATAGGYAVRAGALHTLPAGLVSLLTTGLLRAREKVALARLLSRLPQADLRPLQDVPLAAWLARIPSATVRDLMAGIARVTTYADDPERMSAGATLEQVRLGLRGVLYLHRGWQTLVDGLRQAAEASGARVLAERRATAVERDRGVRGVRLEDGTVVGAEAVIIAGSPAMAEELTANGGATSISDWARHAVPVRAATLDVALSQLPRPHATFAMGTDQPLYASVHSAVARLAPEKGALVHVMRYGGLGVRTPAAVEAQLEELLDLLQPGWRAHVAHRRFVPGLIVSNAVVEAATSGTAGRPGPRVPDVRGLYVAGDWVGPDGMLADAGLASARAAARAVLEDAARATSAA